MRWARLDSWFRSSASVLGCPSFSAWPPRPSLVELPSTAALKVLHAGGAAAAAAAGRCLNRGGIVVGRLRVYSLLSCYCD
jgi:hypothetical protein